MKELMGTPGKLLLGSPPPKFVDEAITRRLARVKKKHFEEDLSFRRSAFGRTG
jgi:hypothetical protein